MPRPTLRLSKIRARAGRKGGASTSARKRSAAKANGAGGGRKPLYTPCPRPRYRYHRFVNNRCPCGVTREDALIGPSC